MESFKLNTKETECEMFRADRSQISHPHEILLDGTHVNISNCKIPCGLCRF